MKLPKEVVKFVVVGTVGFLVNSTTLVLLHGIFGMPLVVSQIISAEFAILCNFGLHHNWTYSDYQSQPLLRRLVKFEASASMGALITTICVWALAIVLHVNYLLALAIGSLASLAWNFLMNRTVVWQTNAREA